VDFLLKFLYVLKLSTGVTPQ